MYIHLVEHTNIVIESFPSLDDICLGCESPYVFWYVRGCEIF